VACPVSTGGVTWRVQLVRGWGGGGPLAEPLRLFRGAHLQRLQALAAPPESCMCGRSAARVGPSASDSPGEEGPGLSENRRT